MAQRQDLIPAPMTIISVRVLKLSPSNVTFREKDHVPAMPPGIKKRSAPSIGVYGLK